jgi:uracil-DNA glycosylase
MHEDWKSILKEEFEKEYYKNILLFIKEEEENGKIIYPKKEKIFKSLEIAPSKIKVIIIGQDPYHGENQANGLAFSVEIGQKIPPSLRNIYKEIEAEFGYKMSKKNGDLTCWFNQGVLLINTSLTVEKSKPGSHKDIGWSQFTDTIIKKISDNFDRKIFILWGSHAIKKQQIIDEKKHLILTSNHPSPFSAYRGFFGNNHFKKANNFLIENNQTPIDWFIKD